MSEGARRTHQSVVEAEGAYVIGGDVTVGQGLGDLCYDATLVWGTERGEDERERERERQRNRKRKDRERERERQRERESHTVLLKETTDRKSTRLNSSH